MRAGGGCLLLIAALVLAGASVAPAQDAGAADPGAAAEPPEASAIRLPPDLHSLLFLERRYKVEALSFKALDESGPDWWGSDEIAIGTRDPEGTTTSPEFGSIDSGDIHSFDPARSCLLAVQPGQSVLGVSSVCEAVGRPGPFWFDLEMWELDDEPIISFPYGCLAEESDTHSGDTCLPRNGSDDFIGDAHLVFTAQELEAALPHVGDTFDETVRLDPCYGDKLCASPWLPDYTVTYRITRLRNVVVGLGDLLDLVTVHLRTRSDLEAVVAGLHEAQPPGPRPVVTDGEAQAAAGD